MGLTGPAEGVASGGCAGFDVGDFFKLFISTSSSPSMTFLEPAPSQLGIWGSASSPPFLDMSNSAYCGGSKTGCFGATAAAAKGVCMGDCCW